MGKNVVEKIDNNVKIRTVLMSVSDKSGLDTFVPGLVEMNPDILILSTGGTYGKIKEILGSNAESCLQKVSDYTGQPETQGGLVKTLDFKIYLGLLTETYNDAHIPKTIAECATTACRCHKKSHTRKGVAFVLWHEFLPDAYQLKDALR